MRVFYLRKTDWRKKKKSKVVLMEKNNTVECRGKVEMCGFEDVMCFPIVCDTFHEKKTPYLMCCILLKCDEWID